MKYYIYYLEDGTLWGGGYKCLPVEDMPEDINIVQMENSIVNDLMEGRKSLNNYYMDVNRQEIKEKITEKTIHRIKPQMPIEPETPKVTYKPKEKITLKEMKEMPEQDFWEGCDISIINDIDFKTLIIRINQEIKYNDEIEVFFTKKDDPLHYLKSIKFNLLKDGKNGSFMLEYTEDLADVAVYFKPFNDDNKYSTQYQAF